MRITDIEVIRLSYELRDGETWRLGGLGEDTGSKGLKVDTAILKVHTDEGITGIGEPTPYAGVAHVPDAVDSLRPSVVGMDPFDVDSLGFQSRSAVRAGREPYVVAGVDMACWDIIGKATGKPVAQLLGGRCADSVPVYASGGIDWRFVNDPELLIAECERYLAAGFDTCKIRVGPDDRFVTAVRRLHEALGDDLDIIVEGNARFDTAEAVRYGRRFAEVDPLWFEEPVDTDDRDAYRELRRALPGLRITGGESKEAPSAFKPWIDDGVYDVVQPDCNVLGITAAKRVADLARLEGIPCVPHNWHNAVTTAANLHLVAAIPNRELFELQRTCHWSCPGFREEILVDPLELRDGRLVVPEKPGLGIELDGAAVEQYPYREGPLQEHWEGPGAA